MWRLFTFFLFVLVWFGFIWFGLVFCFPLKKKKNQNGLLAIRIDFPFVWKDEQQPFSQINDLCMENHFTEDSIPKKIELRFYPLYLNPIADSAAKFEVFSVVQHKKKTGSQQKQKREAKSNNTDSPPQGLCCHRDTNLAFHSASETKHKRIKYCGKHLP